MPTSGSEHESPQRFSTLPSWVSVPVALSYDLALKGSQSTALGILALLSGLVLFFGGIIASAVYPTPYRVPRFLKYCLDDDGSGVPLSEGCANVRFLVGRDLGNPTLVDWLQTQWLPFGSLFLVLVGVIMIAAGLLRDSHADQS